MKVEYKKDILDNIVDEIQRSKYLKRTIDIIYLTYDEAKEIMELMSDARCSSYSLKPNFYIKEYNISCNNTDASGLEIV